jgi:hypothetical protein
MRIKIIFMKSLASPFLAPNIESVSCVIPKAHEKVARS